MSHAAVFVVAFLIVVAVLVVATALHEWWQWRNDR